MTALASTSFTALEVRVRGRVQGVGFRPMIWRLARSLELAGEVLNDGEGVLVRVGGERSRVTAFIDRIECTLPPLARVDAIEKNDYSGALCAEFRIAESSAGVAKTEIAPDAALCSSCAAELHDTGDRHYRYPFTSCTHCGPRLSIVTGIPYDRAKTTMVAFALCPQCRAEYSDANDRRFHAEAIACPHCGPSATLAALAVSTPSDLAGVDAVAIAAKLIAGSAIVAIKGLGGYHLACDARNAEAVGRLRRLKRREAKPFALMARDVDVIRRYCTIGEEEERQLTSMQGPIVLLDANGPKRLPAALAPGLDTLGFMLPTTPLHWLLLQEMEGPLVMTSGNISDEPPIVDDVEARQKLTGIADYMLAHDRQIANRVDDSVVRVMGGGVRLVRRARGFAPSPIKLPPGFAAVPDLLAMGGELKATFCIVKDGQAVLSQHQGDLENTATFDDYRRNLALYQNIFAHQPAALIVDRHPEYLSSKLGRSEARKRSLPLMEVQHHHAHVASCLAENNYPLDGPAALGIVLDGLGYGDDGAIWGGEFLLADYRGYRRVARLKPVAMPGGMQAVREPWRNLYGHLVAAIGRSELAQRLSGLELGAYLCRKPLTLIESMIERAINSPPASSCGRLFDAVAAALDVCPDRQAYEGEAAMRLEALAAHSHHKEVAPYSFLIARLRSGLIECDPAPLWRELLDDLAQGVPRFTIAVRFHAGLTNCLVRVVEALARDAVRFDTVALSGGCFQNRILFEGATAQLQDAGFAVLAHAAVPSNDGGLALGQAAIGAARLLEGCRSERTRPCASAFQAASSA